jgi:hypothetical protein
MKKMILEFITLLIAISLLCSPAPTENSSESNPIRLSLEKADRDSAVFSGKPIRAIVDTDDSTFFSDFAWHTGMGKLIIPQGMVSRYAKRFEVDLYWVNYPSRKDIQTSSYFDTVYISIGGGLRESNKVWVKVTNLPVIIDSIMIEDKVFSGSDKTVRYQINNSGNEISVQFFARDLDGKVPDLTFSGNIGKITQSIVNPMLMTYNIPSGAFCDTIHFLVFDHQGSSEYRDVYISSFAKNLPPVIDSIVVEDTTLKGASNYRLFFSLIDTLKVQAYAHDPEENELNYSWSAGFSNMYKVDTLSDDQMSYICTTGDCKQIQTDTSILIDTLKLLVRDNYGDSLNVNIELFKGPQQKRDVKTSDSIFIKPK